MAQECVFCRIVAGDIPARIVHKDDYACAFLDAHPLAAGHTLFVPVRHRTRLEELDAEEARAHLAGLPRIVRAVTTAVDAEGATVAWNNGEAAGQEVPHVHAHIVPRRRDDGAGPIHVMFRDRPTVDGPETDRVAEAIRRALAD